MRFMSLFRAPENTGLALSDPTVAGIRRLVAEMTRTGTLIDTGGLRPSAEGKRVRIAHGALSCTDGPFAEAKEVVGGYMILEAASLDHALELTRRFLAVHGDEWTIECEVREMGCATREP